MWNVGWTLNLASKNVVKGRLIFAWRNAREASENLKETMSKPHKAYFTAKGGFFSSLEGMETVAKIIDELKEVAEVTLKFSDKYLENTINDAIVELLPIEEKDINIASQKQVDKIFRILATATVDWTIMVPIVNLEIEMDELRIGKVRFFKLETDDKERLQSKLEEISKLKSKAPSLASILEKTLEKEFVGKVCAEVIVSAVDLECAEEIGMQTIHMTLDALRFYRLSYIFRDPFYAKEYFDVQGNIHSEKQHVILFSSTQVSFPQTIRGFIRPFKITQVAFNQMKTDGLNTLDDILKKDEKDRTDFEKDLVTSIRFSALSSRDKEIANAFVNSVISLEALLLDEHEAIAVNLGERVAFIIGGNLTERNWYFDQMRRLYRIRCKIVHSGNTDIKRSDLTLLQRSINYKCIVNLLNSYKSENINSIKDLIRWIRNQKFS